MLSQFIFILRSKLSSSSVSSRWKFLSFFLFFGRRKLIHKTTTRKIVPYVYRKKNFLSSFLLNTSHANDEQKIHRRTGGGREMVEEGDTISAMVFTLFYDDANFPFSPLAQNRFDSSFLMLIVTFWMVGTTQNEWGIAFGQSCDGRERKESSLNF